MQFMPDFFHFKNEFNNIKRESLDFCFYIQFIVIVCLRLFLFVIYLYARDVYKDFAYLVNERSIMKMNTPD